MQESTCLVQVNSDLMLVCLANALCPLVSLDRYPDLPELHDMQAIKQAARWLSLSYLQ